MITLPKALVDKFNDWLGREAVDTNRHGEYRKWLRYYLDFCHKYGHGYLDKKSLGLKEGRCLLFAQITPPKYARLPIIKRCLEAFCHHE